MAKQLTGYDAMQLAAEIAKTFGLDPGQVVSINFDCDAGKTEVLTITAKLVPSDTQAEEFLKLLETVAGES